MLRPDKQHTNSTLTIELCPAGLGSSASLADSLANGTVPAKSSQFTALQQHIDDLTKEKFELGRGLKEQQKMAASLAEENLLATEDFNRQVSQAQHQVEANTQLGTRIRFCQGLHAWLSLKTSTRQVSQAPNVL